jgi:hypothetical protein
MAATGNVNLFDSQEATGATERAGVFAVLSLIRQYGFFVF